MTVNSGRQMVFQQRTIQGNIMIRKTLMKKSLLAALILTLSVLAWGSASVKAAACAAPTTDRGSVTSTLNIPSTGTYRIWSRIMTGTAATDNSYSLEVDGANCYVVGDNDGMPTSAWTWVDYQNGTTSSKIDLSLTAGNHTLKMVGREDAVKIDRIIAVTDTTCTPTGTGDNCAPPDTTAPVTSITAPTSGSTVLGTVSIAANASDDSGVVSKVEFYIDGTLVNTDTASPYAYSWNSTLSTNGSHSLVTKAYDGSNNVGTSPTVTVTTNNVTSCLQSTTSWANNSFTSQTGTFTFDFDVTPASSTGLDNAVGLSSGAATGYANLATIVRFNAGGSIDVRNGGAYGADSSVSYVSGTSYHFKVTANIASHTYTVVVTPAGGSATTIATNYAFRTEQASVASLNNWALFQDPDSTGAMTVCNATLNQSTGPKQGDINGDNSVNITDLSLLLSSYNQNTTQCTTNNTYKCDLNSPGDGVVNIFDLSILLSHYGT
jgi:hypothetical protein